MIVCSRKKNIRICFLGILGRKKDEGNIITMFTSNGNSYTDGKKSKKYLFEMGNF